MKNTKTKNACCRILETLDKKAEETCQSIDQKKSKLYGILLNRALKRMTKRDMKRIFSGDREIQG